MTQQQANVQKVMHIINGKDHALRYQIYIKQRTSSRGIFNVLTIVNMFRSSQISPGIWIVSVLAHFNIYEMVNWLILTTGQPVEAYFIHRC